MERKARLSSKRSKSGCGREHVNYFNRPPTRGTVINGLRTCARTDRPLSLCQRHPRAARTLHRPSLYAAANAPVVGRQAELNLLTDWVTNAELASVHAARILNVVAIGGMGKSALTWKWFNDDRTAGNAAAGRAHVVEFLRERRLHLKTSSSAHWPTSPATVARRCSKFPAPDRGTQCSAVLDREPFLFVLDGLERILIAYARMDAAHMADDDLDQRTANRVAQAWLSPKARDNRSSASTVAQDRRPARRSVFPQAGAGLRAARILVSTRLYPADLQAVDGRAPHRLFRAIPARVERRRRAEFGAPSGSAARRDAAAAVPQLRSHPLLLQALASEVADTAPRRATLIRWQKAHPDL